MLKISTNFSPNASEYYSICSSNLRTLWIDSVTNVGVSKELQHDGNDPQQFSIDRDLYEQDTDKEHKETVLKQARKVFYFQSDKYFFGQQLFCQFRRDVQKYERGENIGRRLRRRSSLALFEGYRQLFGILRHGL